MDFNFNLLKQAIFRQPKNNIILENSNMGSDKWYKDKYLEFKNKLLNTSDI